MKIAAPKGGACALIYYQGVSEPETTDFFLRFLRPGMVVFDVGAHIGEYTLLSARSVGPQGEVHAFEPNPEIFSLLSQNVRTNSFTNVFLNAFAVSDVDADTEFYVFAEPSVASLRQRSVQEPAKRMIVPCHRLDTYWGGREKDVHLIKIDVEGGELLVLRGAERLLALPEGRAPVWVFEYSQANYAQFGYQFGEICRLLRRYDHQLWMHDSAARLVPVDRDFVAPVAQGAVNLIAAKGTDAPLTFSLPA